MVSLEDDSDVVPLAELEPLPCGGGNKHTKTEIEIVRRVLMREAG
jgi:hypothetical protein